MYEHELTLKEKEEGRRYILSSLWDNGEVMKEFNGLGIECYYSPLEIETLEYIKDDISAIELRIEKEYWRV